MENSGYKHMKESVKLPEEWADWKITGFVGGGSDFYVYRAVKESDDKTFVSAIKVFDLEFPMDESDEKTPVQQTNGNKDTVSAYYEAFVDSMKSLYIMNECTNIVSIQDHAIVKQTDRLMIFLRMEFLTCLMDYQREHFFTEDDAIKLGLDICNALRYCEKKQTAHADIKPEHIYITKQGDFKLGDFVSADLSSEMDNSNDSFDALAYAAPEVYHSAQNEKFESSVDQYSLGMVLYQVMNRNRPPLLEGEKQIYSHGEIEEVRRKRFDGALLPAPADASEEFAQIILKACSYDPEDRYSNAEEMYNALEQLRLNRRRMQDDDPDGTVNLDEVQRNRDQT